MGTVTAAFAAAATADGATIRTGSPVARIALEGDRVSGVELESGETHRRRDRGLERRSGADAARLARRA